MSTESTYARELNTTALLGPILREGLDRENVREALEAAWENGRVHEPRINQHEAVIEKDGVMTDSISHSCATMRPRPRPCSTWSYRRLLTIKAGCAMGSLVGALLAVWVFVLAVRAA